MEILPTRLHSTQVISIPAQASPGQRQVYNRLLESIKTIAPDFDGPLTPEESVKLQLEVIDQVTVADSGAFLSQYGNKRWV